MLHGRSGLGIPAISGIHILMLDIFAQRDLPGFGGCGVHSEQTITAVLRILFLSMVFMSLLYAFSQATAIYPKARDGTLLQCHGEHEGLDCAFGFAPIAVLQVRIPLGSQA